MSAFRIAGFWMLALPALVLLSCQEQAEQPRLSDEAMSRIMADLYVAEAATNGLSGYKKDSLMFAYYEQVFDLHGVSRADYERDLRLIARDESRMEEIVGAATALLEPEEQKRE